VCVHKNVTTGADVIGAVPTNPVAAATANPTSSATIICADRKNGEPTTSRRRIAPKTEKPSPTHAACPHGKLVCATRVLGHAAKMGFPPPARRWA